MSSDLAHRLARELRWEYMLAAPADDGDYYYILGFADHRWWVAKRGRRGEELLFPDGTATKVLCRGVMGDCDLEDDGDGLLIATVPTAGDDDEYVTSDFYSDDGGETWRLFVS